MEGASLPDDEAGFMLMASQKPLVMDDISPSVSAPTSPEHSPPDFKDTQELTEDPIVPARCPSPVIADSQDLSGFTQELDAPLDCRAAEEDFFEGCGQAPEPGDAIPVAGCWPGGMRARDEPLSDRLEASQSTGVPGEQIETESAAQGEADTDQQETQGKSGKQAKLAVSWEEGPADDSSPREGQACLLYTSDAADEEDSVDLGGCRII
eukprot:TRINITY_DN7270_c0_g2_i1.p1 TRINITY_DN7270_c0_g2~~TRINITY_DN7270_c0_g2_i1.p1  ORF type:complete len:209 (-),score=33.01 TRINITY_DN7270_c0_g2_i1:58-684(-)